MPRIPDATSLGDRLVPQAQRQVQGYRVPEVVGYGGALKALGGEMQKAADEEEDKRQRYLLGKAKTELMKADLEAKSQLESDPDFMARPDKYSKMMDEARTRIAGGLSGPYADSLDLDFEETKTRGFFGLKSSAQNQWRQQENGIYNSDYDILTAKAAEALSSGNKEEYNRTLDLIGERTYSAMASGIIDGSVGAKRLTGGIGVDVGRAAAARMPPKTLIEHSRRIGIATPESAIKQTIALEGGYVPIDGASGSPAIYGINRKWHQGAFDEAKKITDEKGAAAGKAYAEKFYKEQFWDKNNIGALPEGIRAVAFDTFVNHTPEFAAKAVKEAGGDAGKLIELRREEYQRLARENPEKHGSSLKGWLNRLEGLGAQQREPVEITALDSYRMQDPEGYKRDVDSAVKRYEQDILLQNELSDIEKIENEISLREMVFDDSQSYEQRVKNINEHDLLGKVRPQFAEEARRYLLSAEKINAATNAAEMADIVTRMYDLNASAGLDNKSYLIGVRNIQQDIMKKRADGKISKDDEEKLNNQMRTLMSNKASEATRSVSTYFGEANKMINSQLPPEYRGQAVRELFYNTLELSSKAKSKEDRAALKSAYKSEAGKIIDRMNQDRRNGALKTIERIKSNPVADNDAFLSSKGYTMDDVRATAQKYNLTEQQVIDRLRGR